MIEKIKFFLHLYKRKNNIMISNDYYSRKRDIVSIFGGEWSDFKIKNSKFIDFIYDDLWLKK